MESVAESAWRAARERAARLIETGDHRGAVSALQAAVQEDPGGSSHALMASPASTSSSTRPRSSTTRRRLRASPGEGLAGAQAARAGQRFARVAVAGPELRFFDRAEVLAPPTVPPGALPRPPGPGAVPLRRALVGLGSGVGLIGATLFGLLTRVHGRLAGYHGDVWTNWYRRPLFRGILTLAYMRDELNRRRLIDAYPKGSLTAFQAPNQVPPAGVESFRTADGSWNNLENPMEGAAGTRFSATSSRRDPAREGARLLTPSPREVSRVLLTRGPR